MRVFLFYFEIPYQVECESRSVPNETVLVSIILCDYELAQSVRPFEIQSHTRIDFEWQ